MSENHRKNSSHSSEAPELSNRFQDQAIDQNTSEDRESISRYSGEVKREKTERGEESYLHIGAELELLETVEELLSSSFEADLHRELIDIYDGDVRGKEAELQLKNEGYSLVDAREATKLMIENDLLEVDSPGVYKPTKEGTTVYDVLKHL